MSISTSLRPSRRRTLGIWAKATTATSHHQVTPSPGCTTVGVGLAGGPEAADALEGRGELGVVDPHGLDAHAHAHVVHGALLDEVHERQVGAVEQDLRRDVGDLDALPVERRCSRCRRW